VLGLGARGVFMKRRGSDACRERFHRGVWPGDGCPAEVARCSTRRRLVRRRDRFGLGAAGFSSLRCVRNRYTRSTRASRSELSECRRCGCANCVWQLNLAFGPVQTT
jgi:hypothetical protein